MVRARFPSNGVTIPQALQLALQHHQAGQLAEAEALYRQILAVAPQHPEALHSLGILAGQAGHGEAAVELMCAALAVAPHDSVMHSNLGEEYRKLGRLDEAIAAHRQAVALDSNDAIAWYNLGVALGLKGQVEEGIATYRAALRLAPDYGPAHNNLGILLRDVNEIGAAETALRRAIALDPVNVEAHNNLGSVLKDQGRLTEALACYRHALHLQPTHAEARSNLLLDHHYLPDVDPEALFREHCRWGKIHADPLAPSIRPHLNDRNPERRLKVGYVSADFWLHPVGMFLEPLLAGHDRAQVETYCYANAARVDAMTRRLQAQASHWREIAGQRDEHVAERIRADGIDVLVDLTGHTAHHRLAIFARQPAPVQVTYLGYCDTTGLRTIGYRFTDAHADPPGATEHLHTEELIRLAGGTWCFQPPADSPPVSAPPSASAGHVTFGCFNIRSKITDAMLGLWARVLHAVPGSRLLLKSHLFADAAIATGVRDYLTGLGVSGDRLAFLPRLPGLTEHLAAFGRVDLALDTFPYHGTTTTCEALWMGVPVVTLAGKTHVSRVGVSLLHRVGLEELIATDVEQYVEFAIRLARDLPRLAEMRAALRGRMQTSPLMDGPGFARNVEDAYRQMWRARCARACSNPPA